MKKIFAMLFALMALFGGGFLRAQNCEEIVAPYLQRGNIDPEVYPQPKLEWQCQFSHNSFYLCDQVPSQARVFSISELTHVLTGQHPAADITVDLEHWSYYAYNFEELQTLYEHQTLYFELRGNEHRYLALRPWLEAHDRTERPEKYQ